MNFSIIIAIYFYIYHLYEYMHAGAHYTMTVDMARRDE